jgi:hypothetical protein
MNEQINIAAFSFFSCYLVFSLTKKTYILLNKLELLETNLGNIKERLNDLELFKLKVYNQEIVPGRRAWDEIDIDIDMDMDFDEEID